MAVRVYHGICPTAANDRIKKVGVEDADLIPGEFEFQPGDLLSVYFKDTNTHGSPSLAVYNGDPDKETSSEIDTGKSIKLHNFKNEDSSNLWREGETLIFCYVEVANNGESTYYWETLNHILASTDRYGATLLVGEENMQLSDWLEESSPTDYTTALTPGVLKQFYKNLVGKSSDGDDSGSEEEPSLFKPAITLNWEKATYVYPAEGSDADQLLGTIYLNDYIDGGAKIEYPLYQTMASILTRLLQTHGVPTNTSQLYNDAEGNNHRRASGDGNYFITNVLPASAHLYFKDGDTNRLFLIPNNGNNRTVIARDFSVGSLEDNKSTLLHGNLTVDGNSALKGKLTVGTNTDSGKVGASIYGPLNVTGAISAGSNQISTSGTIKAGTFYEKIKNGEYKTLSSIYQKKMRVNVYSAKHSIGRNNSTSICFIDTKLKESGDWVPVGIIGFNFNDIPGREEEGAPSFCHLWENSTITRNGTYQIRYAIRNYWQSRATNEIIVYFKTLEWYRG